VTGRATSKVARLDNTLSQGRRRAGRSAAAAVGAALTLAVAAAAGTAEDAAKYLELRQTANGGFAEPGGAPTPGLTAWAVIALRASGRPPEKLAQPVAYLQRTAADLESLTDAELAALALAAAGTPSPDLVARIRAARRADGSLGGLVNATAWGILALRASGEVAPPGSVAYLLSRQRRSGGWPWHPRGAPDSNDTAAAVQALRAAGVGAKSAAITRALAYLRTLQNTDGGFELVDGRGSDVQSTAWAIQAFLAARQRPGAAAYRYLDRMRRADGSFRYSARYAVTPVWVTAQTIPALVGKPLPLR
jgi:squalene cyclase